MFEVCIDVENVDKAVNFYSLGLGMRIEQREKEWAKLTDNSVTFWIMQVLPGSPPAPGAAPRDYRRHWTPVHLDFVVADLDAAVQRAIAAGGKVETHTAGKLATIADPSGHGFDLVQRPAKG